MKKIESVELLAPTFSTYSENLQGIHIIRAYGQEEQILARQHELLDVWFKKMSITSPRDAWLQVRINIVSKIINICAVLVCVQNKG